MVQGMIKKEDLKKLIDSVRKDSSFYGPIKGCEGVSLSKLGPDDEVALDYSNFKLPPKRLFFPQTEVICNYEEGGMANPPLPGEKVILFGLRPCDTLSFVYLDKIFLDEKFIDTYYGQKRENALIISLACNEPVPTCFCTSIGGSPTGKEGADILAFVIKDSLLFEACSKKGQAFMDTNSDIFRKPTQADIKLKQQLVSSMEKKVPTVNISGITEKLQGSFDSPIWERVAQRCLGCGSCTYLCATCHCFGIYDEKSGLKGRRIRAQDSCMYPFFTLEASGHNPRTTNGERMKQRIMHKFRYTVENFGDVFCVACGRCISNCPVNIDIRETVEEVVR